MRELAGRTAIITGSSRGLGVYIARALARQHMHLVLAARSAPELETLAVELGETGVRALAVPTDVADAASRAALIDRATAEFGAVDVLVNNAGIEQHLSFHQLDPAEIEGMIAVNLTGAMLLTALVLPGMVERRRGHVVNMASLAGVAGVPFNATYSATKAGLIAFTASLRAEYHGTGVSASVICPGFVSDSGMFERAQAETGVKAPRLLGTSSPTDVARAVVRAIKRDSGQVIVNPGPIRLLTATGQLFPGFAERFVRLTGTRRLFEQQAKHHERARKSGPGLDS